MYDKVPQVLLNEDPREKAVDYHTEKATRPGSFGMKQTKLDRKVDFSKGLLKLEWSLMIQLSIFLAIGRLF